MIAAVVGEGGSGGAVAIAAANRVLMFEHAVYSVISPEGCASILWRTADKAADAAEAMRVTASDLQALGVVDRIVANRWAARIALPAEAIGSLKAAIVEELDGLAKLGRATVAGAAPGQIPRHRLSTSDRYGTIDCDRRSFWRNPELAMELVMRTAARLARRHGGAGLADAFDGRGPDTTARLSQPARRRRKRRGSTRSRRRVRRCRNGPARCLCRRRRPAGRGLFRVRPTPARSITSRRSTARSRTLSRCRAAMSISPAS